MTVALGDLVAGKYRLLELLGAGGWGKVYSGENVRTLHRVAIKVLHPAMAARRDMIHRFEREAQAAGRIGSDHIIEVFDLGELPGGGHYMVMELLDGEELSTRFKRTGPMDPVLLAPIMTQVLDGLAAAHDAGILHRDLKPENLFLVRTRSGEDFVKILDFGISKFREAPKNTTVSGAVLGSPSYMSPEQARGSKEIDNRSDVYSIGVVLYEGVTGTLPFEGENLNELLFKIALTETPPDPCAVRSDLDPEFGAIIRKTLDRNPSNRWQSAKELGDALRGWMKSKGLTPAEAALLRRAHATPSGERSVRISMDALAQPNAETIAVASSPRISEVSLPRSHSAEVQVLSAPPRPVVRSPARKPVLAAVLVVVALTVAGVALHLTGAKDAAVASPIDPPARPSVELEAPANVVQVPLPLEPPPRVAPVASTPPVAGKPPASALASAKPLRPTSSSAASASSSAPTKSVGTIEGRQIRTGL
jgi:serine/threonine-protein kinase